DYSIADMAIFPWAARFEWQSVDLNSFPHVKRWYQAISARPAVVKGFDVPVGGARIPMPKELTSA
ncbi:MAG: glutathione binding-like protein, partial [Burkholderiaceae bacterium]